MKSILITLIRDESDIVVPFLRHAAALFDGGFLLDHRSSDGTSGALMSFARQYKDWSYYALDFSGHHQGEMSTIFAARAFERGADCVFFLDADEFIKDLSSNDVREIAKCLNDQSIIGTFWWRMCIPQTFSEFRFSIEEPMWVSSHDAISCKVVVPRTVYEASGKQLTFAQGNHYVSSAHSRLDTVAMGSIFHIPIRSRKQALKKAIRGRVAYVAKGDISGQESFQWFELLQLLNANQLTDAVLQEYLLSYGLQRSKSQRIPSSPQNLESFGFARGVLPVSLSGCPIDAPEEVEEMEAVAKMLACFDIEDGTKPAFDLVGNTVRWKPGANQFKSFTEARNLIKAYSDRIAQLEGAARSPSESHPPHRSSQS